MKFDAEGYQAIKELPDKINFVYVPKLINAMSWDFTEGNFLDYGCGPGSTAHALILPKVEATNSQLYSNDISLKMVEFAQEKFPHPRIHYKLGCFPDTFPFENVQFDKIYSVNVFNFIKDIKVTLEGLKTVLKPGGQIGFTSITINSPSIQSFKILSECPIWGKYFGELKDIIPEWSDYEDASPEEFYRNIFVEQTGLKEVLFVVTNDKMEMDTEKTIDGLISMNPCVSNVPENLFADFKTYLRELVTRLFGSPADAKTVLVSFQYIYAVLEKPDMKSI